ncbi:DUF1156 domain-containing protein [Endozoicomonas acroporae]|uniref:DUF1156 domain-containing protein n=1 Tax=Endozoicomonas acroporae TaxID=1701104 RepID=UPI0019D5C039|nr:DUF1156 domain-containing protein [Endozoicomonas acroporae]
MALPLDDINAAAAREKSIRHGHPSTLHLWWARRPLAAARAVIFAQMVNDPGFEIGAGFRRGVNKKEAEIKREKLFDIIRDLVKWENTNNEEVLNRARAAIRESWRETCELNKKHPQAAELFNPEKLPAFHDPFAGGGAIPLEAQRLGLESYASDLNPVAVMINKAMIEIPPKFAGQAPVGPLVPGDHQPDLHEDWSGAKGLAEDVRRYGHWMREEAFKRIGHLYPKVLITEAMAADREDLKAYVGEELAVIAWIWARTVKSPNPAFSHVDVPLASSFVLSSKREKQVWIEPVISGDKYKFKVRTGEYPKEIKNGTKAARGANFTCLMSDAAIPGGYIKSEGLSGRIGHTLMAVALEGNRERVFLSPTLEMEELATSASPSWAPSALIPEDKRSMFTPLYGLKTFGNLFSARQLVAINTFSELVREARNKVLGDFENSQNLQSLPYNSSQYADAISVYLSFIVDRVIDRHSTIATWDSSPTKLQLRNTFARQAIPMTWDYGEGNPFCSSSGTFGSSIDWVTKAILKLPAQGNGTAVQANGQTQDISHLKVVSTDPPYYDNIGYADLSDFFYIWMRRSLKSSFPALFSTMVILKAEELVANPYRQGGKDRAEKFFLDGMTEAMHNMAEKAHPSFPVSIYYAFKQSETKEKGTASTGWETFLEAVLRAGFSIVGTWPMRTEMGNRMIGSGTNALASSIVLVCQKRETTAESISRRQFQRQLREEMPLAMEAMIGGTEGASPIAPVDLAQSAIGPGMAIFSRYESVLNQDGTKMSVHDALILINRAISEYLDPDSGSFDPDTLFCDSWFAEYGWSEGPFGQADTLARAKGTAVNGVVEAGVLESGGGKVRLLKWQEYATSWDPKQDHRVPVWQACHQLILILNQRGETDAGALLARMPELGEPIRQLAYHLYTLCERKKWAEEARAYNELIGSWHNIVAASQEVGVRDQQHTMNF